LPSSDRRTVTLAVTTRAQRVDHLLDLIQHLLALGRRELDSEHDRRGLVRLERLDVWRTRTPAPWC
jgi:hypothetical protein